MQTQIVPKVVGALPNKLIHAEIKSPASEEQTLPSDNTDHEVSDRDNLHQFASSHGETNGNDASIEDLVFENVQPDHSLRKFRSLPPQFEVIVSTTHCFQFLILF